MSAIRPVSVIMAAFDAEATIARAVASVLSGSWPHFEVIVIADDGVDYQSVLGRAGIADPRIAFTQTGVIGGGSSLARNMGLDMARYDLAACLDADDAFKPEKLARMAPLAAAHGLASCALDVTLPDGTHLRHVGAGPDQILSAQTYKMVNFSMDAMLVHDRRRADPRYDTTLRCFTDFDFLLKLFALIPSCRHLGTPLHDYVKMAVSISNGPGVAQKMIATKTMLRQRLADGHYGLSEGAVAGLDGFLALSLAAEQSFAPRPDAMPPDLFEDHIAPLLAGRSRPSTER